jgi:ATP-dependent DNA helicase DinG
MLKKIEQTAESLLSEISFDCPEIFDGRDGFAFQAFECAVFETALANNRYDYTAFNIHSGKSDLIERRRNPLRHTDEDITAILRKLRASRVAGKGRIEIDSGTPLRAEKFRAVMCELFQNVLPRYGYTVRDGQIELAEKLLDAIAGRGTLLAEAAVGIGKTLAYIIMAILAKRGRLNEHWNTAYFPEMSVVEWKRMPVIVSTASIALQRAIEKDVIPEISRILLENGVITEPVKAVLAKGKSHYVCDYNLKAYLPFEKKPEIASVLQRIAFDGSKIDLAEIDGLTPHVKKKICIPGRCYKNCPYADDCRFKAYREAMKKDETDIIICNHNLLLADAKLRAETGNSVLPPYQMMILDEAHEVLQAARSIYGSQLNSETIKDITQAALHLDFSPLLTSGTEDWRDVRDVVQRLAEKLAGQNKKLFAKGDAGTESDRYMRNIRSIAGELHYALRKAYPFKSRRDDERKNALIAELERLDKLVGSMEKISENIRWFEKDGTTLRSLPKNLSKILHADLWKRGVPAMLTSGTLAVGGDFSALKQSVGLTGVKRITETTQPSPYDHERNCRLYIPEHIPFPNQSKKSYLSALTNEIERLIRVSHGHTAVLFTSYYVMEKVHSELKKRGLPFPLFKLERSTSAAIEQFKKSGNGVLLASGSLWQGIDIPGDLLSTLIIAKLPFQQPDAISEFERSRYPSFRAYLENVIIPEMLIRLKQGFGRLLRSMSDTGIVAILDSRVNSLGSYRGITLDALPFCPVTNKIDQLDKYLRSVKPPEYFSMAAA